MSQANSTNTTDAGRRAFLSVSAGAAAAVAAIAVPKALASPLDDSALVKLEELIFEQYEGACAFDAEIIRLSDIWTTESNRLYQESLDAEGSCPLGPKERWALITDMPECKEHSRLSRLQEPFYVRMDALVKQMFATPAHTAEGRRAKATVLLGCILGDDWRGTDEETDYPEMMARRLLIEFIGGEPGEMLRGQFA
jgi:hypothetical protein